MFEYAPTSRQRDSISYLKWLSNPRGDPRCDLPWETLFATLTANDPDNFKNDDEHDRGVVAWNFMDILGAPPLFNRWESGVATIDSNLAIAGTVFTAFPFAQEGDAQAGVIITDAYVYAVDTTPINITQGTIDFEIYDPTYTLGAPTWVPVTSAFSLGALNKPLDCVHGALTATAKARIFVAKARDLGIAIRIGQKFMPANASANYCFGLIFERVSYPFAIPY